MIDRARYEGIKKSLVIEYSWLSALDQLSNEQAGLLFKAAVKYDREGQVPDFSDDPLLKLAWAFMEPGIDANYTNWAATVERNRENGKKNTGKKGKQKDSDSDPSKDDSTGEPKASYSAVVEMTHSEYRGLCDKYGKAAVDTKINDLTLYCKSNGRTYDDYAATLEIWLKRDGITGKPADTQEAKDEEPDYAAMFGQE